MPITDALLPEFDREMGTTRKLLERVPDHCMRWKPHEKSMSLGRLATHVAEIPKWGGYALSQAELDISGPYTPAEEPSKDAILALFDKTVADTRKLLSSKTDAEFMETWSLKRDGKTLFTMPKAAVIRGMVMNHLIHHRGQLSVYLRLQGVPLPPMYGPTADEGVL